MIDSLLPEDHEGLGFLARKSYLQSSQIFTLQQHGSIG